MRDRPSWRFLAALALISALCGYLLVGCVHPDPCDLDVAYCLANGGTWVQDEGEACGHCEYPPPPCDEEIRERERVLCETRCAPWPCVEEDPCVFQCDWTDEWDDECDQALEEAGGVWCGDAGQTCSTPDSPCVHNPTTDPRHCEPAPPCQEPSPSCEPPGFIPTGYLEKQLVPMGQPTPKYHDEILRATQALGDRRQCTPRESLDAVAAQLALQLPDVPIISGIEATFVERSPGGLWDEYHTVGHTDNGWTGAGRGKYIGAHKLEPLDCGGNFARWNQGCPVPLGNGWHHCTPLVGPDVAYCREQGWDREYCPPRPDGDPEREACEVQVMGGDATWSSDGRVVRRNRLVVKTPDGTWLEVCLANGTHCRRGGVE